MSGKPKIPCVRCAVDAPERISGMLMPKSELFKNGWHVHKTSGNVPGTVLEQQYIVFLDDEPYADLMRELYHA